MDLDSIPAQGPAPSSPRHPHVPNHLLLQWHITERCNLRCDHCYQECYGGEELHFDQWIGILDQYRALLREWRQTSRNSPRRPTGHITVTGGEPFVHRDFLRLLDVFASHKAEYSFAILSNGFFIDEAMAVRLRELGPSFVQISLEGTSQTHDRIRGTGTYARAVAALQHLRRAGVQTLISFTAHRANYREFADVARLGCELGVDRVWSDRLIPHGAGGALHEQLLTPGETREFMALMAQARARAQQKWFNRTEISLHRALQFLHGGGQAYRCTAGDSLITVQPNGDVLPCRRMPIKVGSLKHSTLRAIYDNSPLLAELRDRNRLSQGCDGCSYAKGCRGGLKCLSYAVAGDPFTADPGCWLAETDPESPSPRGDSGRAPNPVTMAGLGCDGL